MGYPVLLLRCVPKLAPCGWITREGAGGERVHPPISWAGMLPVHDYVEDGGPRGWTVLSFSGPYFIVTHCDSRFPAISPCGPHLTLYRNCISLFFVNIFQIFLDENVALQVPHLMV